MTLWQWKSVVDDLLERMLSNEDAEPQTGGVITSEKKVSWRAYREADQISERSWIPELITKIQSESNNKVRDAAYFILGKITKNTSDSNAVQFLIDQAYKETDRYISSSIYNLLADVNKPERTDISTLKLVAVDDDALVRHAAIRALGGCESSEAEDTLISISQSSDDHFDIVYANATLNRFGTSRAIPTLEKHLKSRRRDVRDSAKYAIDEIRRREVQTNE